MINEDKVCFTLKTAKFSKVKEILVLLFSFPWK